MIRLLGVLIVLLAIALTVWGVIRNDGVIVIEWLDYYVETSLTFAAIVIFFCLLLFTILFNALSFLSRLPEEISEKFYVKKNKKVLFNLLDSFASIASFNVDRAKMLMKKIPNNSNHGQYNQILSFYKILEIKIAEESEDDIEKEKKFKEIMLDKLLYPAVIRKFINLKVKQERYSEALEYVEDSIKAFPKTLPVLSNALLIYKKTNIWTKAAQVLKAIEKYFPNYEIKEDLQEIYIAHAVQLNEDSDFKEATLKLEYLNKRFPENVSAAIFLALLYNKTGNKKAALKILEKTWKLSPDVDIAFSMLQMMETENVAKKILVLEALISERSDSYCGYVVLAKFLLAENMVQKAQLIVQKYLEHNTPNTYIALVMAMIEAKSLANNNELCNWLDRIDSVVFQK